MRSELYQSSKRTKTRRSLGLERDSSVLITQAHFVQGQRLVRIENFSIPLLMDALAVDTKAQRVFAPEKGFGKLITNHPAVDIKETTSIINYLHPRQPIHPHMAATCRRKQIVVLRNVRFVHDDEKAEKEQPAIDFPFANKALPSRHHPKAAADPFSTFLVCFPVREGFSSIAIVGRPSDNVPSRGESNYVSLMSCQSYLQVP